jgi:hypothetical protein
MVPGVRAAAASTLSAFIGRSFVWVAEDAACVVDAETGYPPLVNIETGPELWGFGDTTQTPPEVAFIDGTDTMTTFGSFTNNDFLTSVESFIGPGVGVDVPVGTQVDLATFGGGFGNEWIDLPTGAGSDTGISDQLITPFGDYELMGSSFSEITSALAG